MGEPLPSFLLSFSKLHSGKTGKRTEQLARSILLSEITAEDWMAMAMTMPLYVI